MKVLESLILALLLDGHVQVVKIWKVLSLFFELKSFTLTLAMDMLEGFIFALLLKAIRGEQNDGKAWLSYNWYPTTPKAAEPKIICS